jgi:hypothetical protein
MFTVATNGEIRLVRERGQQVEAPSRLGRFHLLEETALEGLP